MLVYDIISPRPSLVPWLSRKITESLGMRLPKTLLSKQEVGGRKDIHCDVNLKV